MAEAGERSPGGMAALLGAELDSVRSICERAGQESGQPVVIANDNCPGQIVISGDNTAVDRALELAKTQGIKRAVRLAVSVATHSPLMAHASAAFHAALDATPLADPHYPVIGNTTAAPLRTADDIRAELNAQLINTVRWRESVEAMLNLGVRTFFELGPKEVLTGLLKRIDRDATGTPINTTTGLASLS
jgi:[acyl-carrier-protein] S-malonyltransferase